MNLDLLHPLVKPPECSRCPAFNADVKARPNCLGFVPDYVPPNPLVAFLAEAAGSDEKAERIPMVGGSGRVLDEAVQKAGYSRSHYAVHNVLRGQPIGAKGEVNKYPAGELRRAAEIYCRRWDRTSNISMNPRGLLDFEPTHYFITFHPSNVLRTPSLRRIFDADIAKVFRLTHEKNYRFLVFLGETARELVLPGKIRAGIFKCRSHYGRLDWSEFKTRDWSRFRLNDYTRPEAEDTI